MFLFPFTKNSKSKAEEFLIILRIFANLSCSLFRTSANILTHHKPINFAKIWGYIFPSSYRHHILKEEMMNGYNYKYPKANENQ